MRVSYLLLNYLDYDFKEIEKKEEEEKEEHSQNYVLARNQTRWNKKRRK